MIDGEGWAINGEVGGLMGRLGDQWRGWGAMGRLGERWGGWGSDGEVGGAMGWSSQIWPLAAARAGISRYMV